MSAFRSLFLSLAVFFSVATVVSLFCNFALEQGTKRNVTYFYLEMDRTQTVQVLTTSAPVLLEAKNTSTMPFALTMGDGTIVPSVLEELQSIELNFQHRSFQMGIGERALVELRSARAFDIRVVSQTEIDLNIPLAGSLKPLLVAMILSILFYLAWPFVSQSSDEKAKRAHTAEF